jgi:hypothetical protein
VKEKAELYLPKPNPTDTSEENKSRYKQYIERAMFYGVTGRTLRGLTGLAFKSDPAITLPKTLEVMESDADGAGVSLNQLAYKAHSLVMAFGRAGVFTDYPATEGATTRAQLEAALVRPTIQLVEPWDIINWRTICVGGKLKLSLVVLSEEYVTDDDGFEQECDDQWRVLRLDEDGLYVMEEWIRDPNNKNEYVIKKINEQEARYFPTDASGKRLDYIPFAFIGATNNDSNPDLPPLYDLASLNIGHYRNSADYEESAFLVGQPTPVLAGLTEDWVKNVLKGKVLLGSRGAIPLPVGGSAMLLQAAPNIMPKEAMELKEKQMVAIGAKLVDASAPQRTATEARMENAGEQSVLTMVTKNVSSAFVQALEWAGYFVDKTESEIVFEISTDFLPAQIDANGLTQLIAAWQGRALSFTEMRKKLRDSGYATQTDEEAKDELDSEEIQPTAPNETTPV